MFKRLRSNRTLGLLIVCYIALLYFPISALILELPEGLSMLFVMGLSLINLVAVLPLFIAMTVVKDLPEKKGLAGIIMMVEFLLLVGGNVGYMIGASFIDPPSSGASSGAVASPAGASQGGDGATSESFAAAVFDSDPAVMLTAIVGGVLGIVIFVLLVLFVPPLKKVVFPYRDRGKNDNGSSKKGTKSLNSSGRYKTAGVTMGILTLSYCVAPIIWGAQGKYVGDVFRHLLIYVGLALIAMLSVFIMDQFPKNSNESGGMTFARYFLPFLVSAGANWLYLFLMSGWIDGFSVASVTQASILAAIYSVCTVISLLIFAAPKQDKLANMANQKNGQNSTPVSRDTSQQSIAKQLAYEAQQEHARRQRR